MKKDILISKAITEITQGLYKSGEKFDSVRDLSQRYKVSHVTASVILNELVSTGLLDSKERSGHYVTQDKALLIRYGSSNTSRPTKENLLAHLVESENSQEIIALGTAATMTELVPTKELMDSIPSKSLHFKDSLSKYSYPPGNFELRFQISKLMNRSKADDIILTNGATEGMFLAVNSIIKPGDSVLINSPTFYGTINLLQSFNINIIEITNSIEKINFPKIEHELKTNKTIKAGIFQVNIPNPHGRSLQDKEKIKLVNLFKKYNRKIIEDDTYSHLSFESEHLNSLYSYDTSEDTVYYCSSFSKTLGPGLRVGWTIPPKDEYKSLLKQKLAMSFSGATNNEALVLSLLKKKGFYNRHIKKVKREFQRNIRYLQMKFEKNLSKEVKVSSPQGAFSIWIELPKSIDTFKIYTKLIEKKIAITPGVVYSSNQNYKNCIRLNCALDFNREVKKAIDEVIYEINTACTITDSKDTDQDQQ